MDPLMTHFPLAAFSRAGPDDAYAKHGFALSTSDNKEFFCGFEQDDQSLAFKSIRQYPGSHEPGDKQFVRMDADIRTDRPVFLGPDEMVRKGLAAIVFPTDYDARVRNGLPAELTKTLYMTEVEKDIAVNGEAPGSDYPLDGFARRALYALASDRAVGQSGSSVPLEAGRHLADKLKKGLASLISKYSETTPETRF